MRGRLYSVRLRTAPLPPDFPLQRLDLPLFHVLYPLTIFLVLPQSATGGVQAFNGRAAHACTTCMGKERGKLARLLIARAYLGLLYLLFPIFVVPALTLRIWRLRRSGSATSA